MQIFLIRHGETDFNTERRYCGSNNPPLNKTGKSQAEKLAARLAARRVDKVYTSDLKRAVETAAMIFKDREAEIMPELREMNFGAFEGLTHEELMLKHRKAYTAWIDNPSSFSPPVAERFEDFRERVLSGLKEIIKENRDNTFAAIIHGGPLKIILGELLDLGPEDFTRIRTDNASLTIVRYPGEGRQKIICLNDTSHLEK